MQALQHMSRAFLWLERCLRDLLPMASYILSSSPVPPNSAAYASSPPGTVSPTTTVTQYSPVARRHGEEEEEAAVHVSSFQNSTSLPALATPSQQGRRGYAFVNFSDMNGRIALIENIEHRQWKGFRSSKAAEISYATIQGKEALIAKFRNPSVMQETPSCCPRIFVSHLAFFGDGGIAGPDCSSPRATTGNPTSAGPSWLSRHPTILPNSAAPLSLRAQMGSSRRTYTHLARYATEEFSNGCCARKSPGRSDWRVARRGRYKIIEGGTASASPSRPSLPGWRGRGNGDALANFKQSEDYRKQTLCGFPSSNLEPTGAASPLSNRGRSLRLPASSTPGKGLKRVLQQIRQRQNLRPVEPLSLAIPLSIRNGAAAAPSAV
ncbi:uncharacterized protein EI97DRAFT_443383 [Westerdykella ornata]|uniref:Mei2-like C-terminal RNA recognition motif domain-containing protein n=1 Tax=Westerdykella ornata TaxID=318751 RepID=A0A6A6JG79_WESOR|nr:uncharacterized protein EI97DRAFT_443383 [Westerdykella ornata]KAF2275133.1 hypothetical protein EI97DRAFT_443383 [Westerdykella ornata]